MLGIVHGDVKLACSAMETHINISARRRGELFSYGIRKSIGIFYTQQPQCSLTL